MLKFKAKKKKETELLIAKISSKDRVNLREVELITNGMISGFLPLICEGKKSVKTFNYNITNYVNLKAFLSKPQTKDSFLSVITQIAKVIRTCLNNNLSPKKIILSCDYVFVDYMTNTLLFIYVPLEDYEYDLAVAFLQEVSRNTNFSSKTDADVFIEFRKYCENLKFFSIVDFERKIEKLSSGVPNEEKKRIHKDHYFSENMVFDPLNDISAPVQKGKTDGVKQQKAIPNDSAQNKRVTKLMKKKEEVKYPSILRLSNNTEIFIDNLEFSIGYDDDCNYSFQDNELISGHHATFYLTDENVFIADDHSTNGTYVNDEEIPYGKKVHIKPGDKITLANEDFIFKGRDS